MTLAKLLVIGGLALDVIGALVIIWWAAWMFIRSWFSKEAKKELMLYAMSLAYGRTLSKDVPSDPHYKRVYGNFKASFVGSMLLVLGFVAQIIGNAI